MLLKYLPPASLETDGHKFSGVCFSDRKLIANEKKKGAQPHDFSLSLSISGGADGILFELGTGSRNSFYIGRKRVRGPDLSKWKSKVQVSSYCQFMPLTHQKTFTVWLILDFGAIADRVSSSCRCRRVRIKNLNLLLDFLFLDLFLKLFTFFYHLVLNFVTCVKLIVKSFPFSEGLFTSTSYLVRSEPKFPTQTLIWLIWLSISTDVT